MTLRLCLAAAVLLFAACDGAGESYPGPLPDLPVVSVADLQQSASVPGRFTVVATVVERTTCSCPPNADCQPCLYPEGILVSDTGTPPSGVPYDFVDGVLSVEARNPDQFGVGQRYRLSVEVTGPRPVYHATLLGYKSE